MYVFGRKMDTHTHRRDIAQDGKVTCGASLEAVITLLWLGHNATDAGLASEPKQYLGLADRAVCSGTVLAQTFKRIRTSLIKERLILTALCKTMKKSNQIGETVRCQFMR